ncbi:MAG: peptide chain release factor N(5)-glutamine methyltransferase [Ignavibacteria bacterium]|nr:peptide chain release factor N(5)-glutamine methyltransferase [Ignavibacteria bacterium]
MNRYESNRNWTISEIIHWGTSYLNKKGCESPRLSIELLLCSVLNTTRLDLYLNFDKPLKKKELDELKSKINLLLRNEPIQYILGWTQFLEFKLSLSRKVFIPRPETEQLVKFIIKKNESKQERKMSILDIGCGSGAISIALASFFRNSQVLAIDIDTNAIEQTKENALLNNVSNIETMELDIFKCVPEGSFDIIVSNPPYIPISEYSELPPQLQNEPKIALTDEKDGLSFYKRFAKIFPRMLKEDGSFYLEVGWNQANLVSEIFAKEGFSVQIEKDFQGIKRIVYSIRF